MYNIKKYIFLKEYFSKYNSKDLITSMFDSHPNELANRIVAKQLLTLMEDQLEIISSSIHNESIR